MHYKIISRDPVCMKEAEPITVQQVKNYMRLDHHDDDRTVGRLISTVREIAESYMGLSLVQHAWRVVYHGSLSTYTDLPYGPIEKVQRVASQRNNQEVVLHPSQYELVSFLPGAVHIKQSFQGEEIAIDYVSGYQRKEVPHGIVQGMLTHISYLYDAGYDANIMPDAVQSYYNFYRLGRIV